MSSALNGDTDGTSGSWMINHLPTILWQRRYYILVPFLILTAAGLLAAFLLPTVYRSAATLLVQSQDLPTTVVDSPVTGAIDQRIARIREQVLSRGDLISTIEQNDLYPDERRSKPMSKIIEEMRHATVVGALAGDIGQESGSQNKTIAISMTFDYPDAGKAQAVLQGFVAKFLSMDTADVEGQASLTVRFLQDQANKLQTQIAQLESQLTALKMRNGSALASSSAPAMIDTGGFTSQITSLQNENRQLLIQSQRPVERNSALATAEANLAAAQSQYSDSHPDVIQARNKVELLRRLAPPQTDGRAGIQAQIAANNQAIQTLIAQRDASVSRVNSAMAGQARAPAVLEEAAQMENRVTALRAQYETVSGNLLKAQNSSRMASEQRAERLSLVEPASLPDRPQSPNRPLLILAGALAGLLGGIVLALGLEIIRKPIRSPKQLEALGVPVIGVVPLLKGSPRPRSFLFFRRREKQFA
jgi:succinoglycan biosynthesis transport protein ExoP